MGHALEGSAEQTQKRTAGANGWGRKMSDHVAFGLLVYTGLQIFVTSVALKANNNSILPYFALVLLVVAIIPACWMIEKRWTDLPEEETRNPDLAGAFARDRAIIWCAAIGLPLGITALIKGLSFLFA